MGWRSALRQDTFESIEMYCHLSLHPDHPHPVTAAADGGTEESNSDSSQQRKESEKEYGPSSTPGPQ